LTNSPKLYVNGITPVAAVSGLLFGLHTAVINGAHLLLPFSGMPADLRAHARYLEIFFRVQAEIYRTFHMRDPQAFYNKEDLWDIARTVQGGRPEAVAPAYVVASLPGEDQAEFLLIIPFTPRNKDNMIGLMVARCDGAHLGELVVLQLSKQELIFGAMQIDARINQDQTISKDLTLWNQQGSQVLRGQMLVLPVANTFLYVMPLYIQAVEARMPPSLLPRAFQAPRQPPARLRRIAASSPSATTCAATANWPRKANGPRPAKNSRPSKRKWGSGRAWVKAYDSR